MLEGMKPRGFHLYTGLLNSGTTGGESDIYLQDVGEERISCKKKGGRSEVYVALLGCRKGKGGVKR